MGLQHRVGGSLYLKRPQAAFLVESFPVFVTPGELGLTATISAAAGADRTLSVGDGWNGQSVNEQQSCGYYKQDAFHGGFLLVLENRAVILSHLLGCRKK